MNTIAECDARIRYWATAAMKAEWAWIRHEGNPWEKERLRRAYEFADRLLLGWHRRRDAIRARAAGGPYLRLVAG